jgi:SAM-dependent methyltransferase
MQLPPDNPDYLAPYLKAVRRHGGGFDSLLWASPTTQAARFDAILSCCDLDGNLVADVGCGRADLLPHLLARGVRPAEYIGIEAVPALADVAENRVAEAGRRSGIHASIVRADFLADPVRLFVGAEIVVLSGSLNTADDTHFYPALRRCFDSAAECLVFNFLCSPTLAAGDHLFWRYREDVEQFAHSISREVQVIEGYLDGDCTIAMRHPAE